jgi:hypothetical protein
VARRKRERSRPPLPRILFFDESADRERSCTSKDAYESEAHARAVALMNGTVNALSVYHCRYCDMWHFTSRRE